MTTSHYQTTLQLQKLYNYARLASKAAAHGDLTSSEAKKAFDAIANDIQEWLNGDDYQTEFETTQIGERLIAIRNS